VLVALLSCFVLAAAVGTAGSGVRPSLVLESI